MIPHAALRVAAASTAAELLRVLRTMWARYRLDRVAMPSTRAEALLRGAIHPSVLSAGERQDLFAIVSIQALAANETVRSKGL